MLRLLLYVLAVFALLFVLRLIPGIGGVFDIPFVGFFLAAAILSAGIGWWTARTVEARRTRSVLREFGAVDTPHNQGKLGTALLTRGNARRALPHLARAAEGEPGRAEWHYRLGQARLATGDARGAVTALTRAAEIDPDHAFGAPLLRLSQAHLAAGDPAESLAAADRYERDRGETAISAFRRGLALRALDRRDQARETFARVGHLAHAHARGARRGSFWLGLRAWVLARL